MCGRDCSDEFRTRWPRQAIEYKCDLRVNTGMNADASTA